MSDSPALLDRLRDRTHWRDLIALGRLDKPIGIYLLLWPALWALWLAAGGWPGWHLFLVFAAGVVLTRTAGCIVNDLADRNFDGHVARTRARPLATGRVSVREALGWAATLFALAFALVLTTNALTAGLSTGALLLACTYPFMKRYTHLPQVVLGAAFSFSIPMAFAAVTGATPILAWYLFSVAVVWTVAYDTQYAMVDREDDRKLGLKSTAILFGDLDRLMIGVLQVLFLGGMWLLHRHATLGIAYDAGLAAAAGLLAYQQHLIRQRQPDGCFRAFLANHWVGLAIFAGLALHYLVAEPPA
jgi:4-hydroxybenzoate polyprenyltransferase